MPKLWTNNESRRRQNLKTIWTTRVESKDAKRINIALKLHRHWIPLLWSLGLASHRLECPRIFLKTPWKIRVASHPALSQVSPSSFFLCLLATTIISSFFFNKMRTTNTKNLRRFSVIWMKCSISFMAKCFIKELVEHATFLKAYP